MRKIPTLFKRDSEDMRHLLPEVTPGCEWVLAGEGVATRKYDGTCCMFDGDRWWARREVKPGKQPPENFQPIETDENTGKTVGWEPIEQSGFAKWHTQALSFPEFQDPPAGTYELCGPKINSNPEGFKAHVLVAHAEAHRLLDRPTELTFETIAEWVQRRSFEGIVWHHPDGRMAKIKRRDFA
jgi:hypothetical protein